MNLIIDPNALEDLKFWVRNDRKKAEKVLKLIEEIYKEPFSGIGKPEPLKHVLSGCWSRRIDEEHRIVYRVENNNITILACRYHY
jgi:toxin YoeB